MTKFEEEVKRPANGPITELNNYMQSVLSQYRKMRQYADYLEYGLKQKDEHILKVENENSFLRDERTTFDSNGMAVEPKLQQQALPVVPECVAKWLDSNNLASLLDEWYCHHEDMSSHIREYFERLPYKGPNNLSEMENNIVTFITQAKLGGYKLEKPQLFYLKHIDMSKSSERYDYYLFKHDGPESLVAISSKGLVPPNKSCKFTQQEIDSMQTGSYEQIPVPVEDGE